jgi:hypothetical protein
MRRRNKMTSVKSTAIKLLENLPEDKLKETVTFMKFLQQKEEWEATEEILSDKKLKTAWKKGKKEVETGKTEDWEKVKQRLFTPKGKSRKNV